MCEYIYIYIMYIYVYTITREKVTTMTMCFFSSFVLIIHRIHRVCCSWSTCSIEYSSPVLPNRKKARQNFISLFLVFLSQTKIKNEGQEEKSAFIQSCAREE